MDKGALTALVLTLVSLMGVFATYLRHKRKGTQHLLTLSHLPPIIRRLVWYGLVPGILVIGVFFVLFGF